MKLTEEILDQLILERLQQLDEDLNVSFSGDLDPHLGTDQTYDKIKQHLNIQGKGSKFASGSTRKRDQLDSLAALIDLAKQEDLSLTIDDVKLARPGSPEYESLLTMARFTKNPDLAKAIRDAIYQVHGGGLRTPKASSGKVGKQAADSTFDVTDAESFTYPRVMNSDASLGAGKFLKSQNNLIQSIFTGKTIKDRVSKFSEVSQAVWAEEGAAIKRAVNARKLLQKIMFIDMVNFYLNEIDSRSGGYSFEALCAMLCGGKVTGGSNGVADFETAKGNKGSSKLYSNYQNITQAAANFKLNDPVHYIIGIIDKISINEEEEEIEKNKKISNIQLCYVICTLVGKTDDGKGIFHTTDAEGTLLSRQVLAMNPNVQVDVVKGTSVSQTRVGFMKLYGGPTKSFKQKIDGIMEKRSGNVKKAFDAMKGFFAQLAKAEEQTKSYISASEKNPDKILQSGNAALSGYDNADEQLVSILELLSPDKEKVTKIGDKRELKENKKLSENLLDKMIQEVILNR